MKMGKGEEERNDSVVLRGAAVEIDLDVLHIEVVGQEVAELVDHFGRHLDIERATSFVVEMSVGSEICAVLGGRALEVYRSN